MEKKVAGERIYSELNEKNQARLRVGRSYAGLGLFARGPFKRGERIVEYIGFKIPNKIANKIIEKWENRYLLDLNSRYTVDGSPRFNLARYANHQCRRPSAEMEVVRGRAFLVARRAIAPGEEITWDYGKEYLDEIIGEGKCLCPSCKEAKAR